MAFHARISAKVRANISYLQREPSLSCRGIARRCSTSPSSAVRICLEGSSSQSTKKRTNRPTLISKNAKGRFIRTFRKTRDENPNVRVVHFWTDKILLYLDGVSFRHNHKLYQDALCTGGKLWRKSNEGMKYKSKGLKNLPAGHSLHLLVGISHSTGVALAEKYEKVNSPWFTKFLQGTLQKVLVICAVLKSKEKLLLVMDNDPTEDVW